MVTNRRRPRDPVVVRRAELDPVDPDAVHDDDEDTDHLRLDEQDPLVRARLIAMLEARA
jgi:hypothetical protein